MRDKVTDNFEVPQEHYLSQDFLGTSGMDVASVILLSQQKAKEKAPGFSLVSGEEDQYELNLLSQY